MKNRFLLTLYIGLALLALPACAFVETITTPQAVPANPGIASTTTSLPGAALTPGAARPPTATQPVQAAAAPATGARPDSQVIGFYVNWDDNSFTSLKVNFSRMDELVPEWLHLTNAGGDIERDNPAKEQAVLDFLKQQGAKLRIVPLLNNYSNHMQDYDSEPVAQMLADSQARTHAIQLLLGYIQKNQFAGVSIDFEGLDASSQPDLTAFMQELYAKFHPLGLEVSISVPVDDPSYDYSALANASDFLILMAYDQNWDVNSPGPVAGQRWFDAYLRQRLAQAPASQYVIGIGNYGYDWNNRSSSVDVIGFQDALDQSNGSKTPVALSTGSLNPNFTYIANNQEHQVWYLDAVTAFNQLVDAQGFAPRGYALWVLGSEDPGIWQVFDHRNQLDQSVAALLQTLKAGYGAAYSQPGKRSITFDPTTGLITGEQIVAYPSP